MPNIQSQEVTATGTLNVVAGGVTFSITKGTILADYEARQGDDATRRLLTRNRIKDDLVATLGAATIDPAYVDVDFEPTTGFPTLLQFRSPGE